MKIKAILLPRKLNSRPVPHWDIGSVMANAWGGEKEFQLIDLETINYYTKKYDDFLEHCQAGDVFKSQNFQLIQSVISDIGSLKADVFYFHIDWWNETLPLAVAVLHQIKKINQKARILLSGPYLNSYGIEILEKFKWIDYIAVSEIEPVFNALLDNDKKNFEIPNIIYFDKETNKIVTTERKAVDINNLKFPKFDCFFNRQYSSPDILPFRLSRGCKYRCFFCACLSSEQLRYYRNIDAVVNQLRHYTHHYNVRSFYFEDDALNFDNDYLESLLDQVIKANLNIQWSAYFIAKDLTAPLIEKIRKAGCVHIRWGIESAQDTVLKSISKNISMPGAERILKQAMRAGIANQISLIVGFPYEEKKSIGLMHNFIRHNKACLKVVNVYTFKPRVGTLAYKFPERYGIEILTDKTIFKKDLVPFDEISGLNWAKKRRVQRAYLKFIEDVVLRNGLLNIDPKDYFKFIISEGL